MATPTFPKINFSQIKASLADRVGTHVKNAGPQAANGFSKKENKKVVKESFDYHTLYNYSPIKIKLIIHALTTSLLRIYSHCLKFYLESFSLKTTIE